MQQQIEILQIKNASFEKTKKKIKSSKTFKTTHNKNLTRPFFLYLSWENKGTDQFPNFL